ncbi:MAG: tRNA (adenosine(37)-N6)-threonylcarbamoyltransferase complex ATPase subunit type 1 TsaE [Coxiella sp. RIFCSPHIGHO2_12_FULL_44_14]|nr:MAG: tRNA (adenosine(37)-N6)-threonylcarbamoyltransferase complex ATPase subunit type 1 TsaE [Coxiella sp. RIFCSPHIGHO2_12_FULL_44_14]
MKMAKHITSPRDMERLGAVLAQRCYPGSVIYLQGELGSGKTTLARGLIRALGYVGHVKSPSYTLIESYPVTNGVVHHLDLYRLKNSHELKALGLHDYLTDQSILLVEWPEIAVHQLPKPHVRCMIEYLNSHHRQVSIEITEAGIA